MPTYIVTIKEIWGQGVTIEADSPTDAIDKVVEGDGNQEETLFEYIQTLDTDTWDVTDAATGDILM